MTVPTLDSRVVTSVEIESSPRLLIDENVVSSINERHDCLRKAIYWSSPFIYLRNTISDEDRLEKP